MRIRLTQTPTIGLISVLGQIAQSVEQRTENPCVGSSILPLAIVKSRTYNYPLNNQFFSAT